MTEARQERHADRRRDAETLRRALKAGVGVFGILGAVLIGFAASQGGSGSLGVVMAMLALTVGALTTAGWLMLAMILDLLAGRPPGRARVAWTALAAAFAALAPLMVLGALRAAG